jgi:hypothetical protein
MILLGSIQRSELQLALSRYLSRERRLLEIERRTLPISQIEMDYKAPHTAPVLETVIVNMPDMKIKRVKPEDTGGETIEGLPEENLDHEEAPVTSRERRPSRFDVTRVQPIMISPPVSAPPSSSQQIKFTLNPSTSVVRSESASPDPSGNSGIPLKSILKNNSPSSSYPGNSSALSYGRRHSKRHFVDFVFSCRTSFLESVLPLLHDQLFPFSIAFVSLNDTDSKKLKQAFDSWFRGRTLSNNRVIIGS